MPKHMVCRYFCKVMKNKILLYGIETNNLKNIDVILDKNRINLIVGSSGSGKTSLAYDTISQIGQHELLSMYADDVTNPTYKVRYYENMVTTIPIRQSNHNNNTRSTIGTFSGLNRGIILLYAYMHHVSEETFCLSKEENTCSCCHGTGTMNEPDIHKIISPNVPIKDNPFRCWKRHQEFYKKILQMVCRDYDIDPEKTFFQLSHREQDFLWEGSSTQKYQVRFKKQSSFSTKTTKFYGVMANMPMIKNFHLSEAFYSEVPCHQCHGKRFCKELERYKIKNLSIGEFFLLRFDELYIVLNQLSTEQLSQAVLFELNKIKKYVKKAVELNLGHLSFGRTIPSLSGGELQRLRMIQVFNASLSDLLIILDEPVAGLSENEKEILFENIQELIPKNTVLIVDHSNSFVHLAGNIIALGPGGGADGGYLIDYKEYLKADVLCPDFSPHSLEKMIQIRIKSRIYGYTGVDISLAAKGLNLIYGKSGVGKSTLLREYFPQQIEKYLYINQKGLVGNANSTVSTAIDVFEPIIKMFAAEFETDKNNFSNQTGKAGMCPNCGGVGYLQYAVTQNHFCKVQCQKCSGTGFNRELKKYCINEKSMFDIWNMTIDEAGQFFASLDKKIEKKLKRASSLMLGHLKIGQQVSTLSGGENIRIKILKASNSTADVIGFDEPFKGLNKREISKVLNYLNDLRETGKTIVVIDHLVEIQNYFEKKIEIIVRPDGVLTEKKSKEKEK